jgi:hypothetical protein
LPNRKKAAEDVVKQLQNAEDLLDYVGKREPAVVVNVKETNSKKSGAIRSGRSRLVM